jgi:hypothetical protein
MELESLNIKRTIGEFKLEISNLNGRTWSTGETIEIEDRHYGREKLNGEYIALAYVRTTMGGLGDERWKYATIHAVETHPGQECQAAFRDGFVHQVFRGDLHDSSKTKSISTAFGELYDTVREWSNGTSTLKQPKHETDHDDAAKKNTLSRKQRSDTNKKARRERGPNAGTIETCREAMKLWLDDDESLTNAAQGLGTDRKTVYRWIPMVLEFADQPTRQRWIKKLHAYKMDKHMGKFRDLSGS